MARWTPTLGELQPVLRCPATGQPLELSPDSLRSRDGERVYPIVHGVPILIAGDRSLFDPEDYLRVPQPGIGTGNGSLRGRAKQVIRQILSSPPTLTRNVVGDENLARFLQALRGRQSARGRCRVLVVGGALLGVGMEQLMSAADIEVLDIDVQFVPGVAVVCDGHDLPFVDGSFDGVICQAVLEHVPDPQRVADEIWRVLAPDGVIYSEVPFIWQVHAGAFDFTRFTHLGHRRMWRRFDEISSGADNGPGVALALSIWYFVTSLAPRRVWPLTTRLVSLLFFWLKELDPWLVKKPAALDAAAGTYFLGSRREAPLTDREIVNGYRGANASPPRLVIHRHGAD